jgi:two-component system catabolic regulation response regulator CreB
MQKPKILVVDDQLTFLKGICAGLESEFMQAIPAASGQEALAALKQHPDISLALVDIGLPDMSGFDLFRQIRATSKIPVVFLTCRDSDVDVVLGLELGAQGYLKKPIGLRVVAAHVKAVLHTAELAAAAATANMNVNTTGNKDAEDDGDEVDFEVQDQPHPDFKIVEKAMAIYYKGINLNLSSKQFIILAAMVRHPQQVFSLGDFLDLTDPEGAATEQSPRNLIKKIRQTLREVAPDENFIRNHHNDGYSLI